MQRSWPWLGGLALILLALAVYFPALQGDFIWDDADYVRDNPVLRDVSGLGRIWFEIGSTAQYYPLVYTSFWVEYHLWGLHTLGYHLVNVLLHAANAFLVWQILRKLEIPGAFVVAALFAVHPVTVESVAWITERKNVLSGFFYLSAMLSYFRFSPPNAAGLDTSRWGWYLLAEVLFVFALLSKTVTATLPAAILLLLWYRRGKLSGKELIYALPLFAWGIALAMLTIYMEHNHVGAQGASWTLTLGDRFVIAGRAFWFYAAKVLVPYPLSFFYERWYLGQLSVLQMMIPVSVVALIVGLFLARKRIGRGPVTAVCFFAGTLLPALGFIDFYPMRYSFVADHFQYLASLGVLTLVVGGIGWLIQERLTQSPGLDVFNRSLAAVAIAVYGGLAFQHAFIFQGPNALWADTVAKQPDSWAAHHNLAIYLTRAGKFEEAVEHFQRAAELNPEAPEPLYNLGVWYQSQRNMKKAVEYYAKSLERNAYYPEALVAMGRVVASQRDYKLAEAYFKRALLAEPRHAEAHRLMARALYTQGKYEEAKPYLLKAIRLRPRFSAAHRDLGDLYLGQGDIQLAEVAYRRAIQIDPALPQNNAALAGLYQAQQKPRLALQYFEQALQLRPDFPSYTNAIARILASDPDPNVRDTEEAVSLAESAVNQTKRTIPAYLDTLGMAYANAGRFEEAVQVLEEAMKLTNRKLQPAFAQQLEQRIALYKEGKAWRSDQPIPAAEFEEGE